MTAQQMVSTSSECLDKTPMPLVFKKFRAMGSVCEIIFYSTKSDATKILDAAIARLFEIENKYTRYSDSSLTSAINRSAGLGLATELDGEAQKLFDYADVLFSQSDGLFDITSGVLRRAWDFKKSIIPSDAEVEKLLPLVGWQFVERTPKSIYLPRIGMEIDLGGFVKEYAADQLAKLLVDSGIYHGLVNLGGDVHVFGPRPDGSPWKVGITHPRKKNEAIAYIPVERGAVATSGDYERFIDVDGQKYSHILDPRTGRPIAPAFTSVTIVNSMCVVAGSFSTIALLKSGENKKWLEESGAEYLVVNHDLTLSGNIKNK